MNILQKTIISGVLMLITIVMGFWLSYLGKPYNTAVFTVHKLIALGTVVFTAFLFKDLIKRTEAEFIILFLIIIGVISIVGLFASGAFLSVGKVSYTAVKTVHVITIISMIMSCGLSLYLLMKK